MLPHHPGAPSNNTVAAYIGIALPLVGEGLDRINKDSIALILWGDRFLLHLLTLVLHRFTLALHDSTIAPPPPA
jgi:hypothetical protein